MRTRRGRRWREKKVLLNFFMLTRRFYFHILMALKMVQKEKKKENLAEAQTTEKFCFHSAPEGRLKN